MHILMSSFENRREALLEGPRTPLAGLRGYKHRSQFRNLKKFNLHPQVGNTAIS